MPSPPRRLALSVACVAASMLLFEVVITRLFSVLFFYHFSFFAVTLAMSGFVIGGILAARWNPARLSDHEFTHRLGLLSAIFAAGLAGAFLLFTGFARPDTAHTPTALGVVSYALLFLPGLVAAGAFLALAFSRNQLWIGTLYAWDLVAASVACLGAIWLLRTIQGPAVLLCPVLLASTAAALLGGSWLVRGAGLALIELGLVLLVSDWAIDWQLLRLRPHVEGRPEPAPMLERWNETSRIRVNDNGPVRWIIIDRAAATAMRAVPPRPDGPVQPDPSWAAGEPYQVYRLGRPLEKVAIIGVGGGADLMPPLFHGAQQVDGYELNQILIDLLQRDFRDFNAIVTRPELRLIHGEARAGITHSGQQYDVIQASMIDTWAATASGGFVLSENGLYTREAWQTFLRHLTPKGVLTMTRWHIQEAPAETHRLVALAGAALADIGLPDATGHVMLVSRTRPWIQASTARQPVFATLLVSRTAFASAEVQRLQQACAAQGLTLMLAPGLPAADPLLPQLLSASTRAAAIQKNRFDIAPPTDERPYFFLQVRPSDLVHITRADFGPITEITFNGVRVLVILSVCALVLVLVVTLLTAFGLPGRAASPRQRRDYRLMSLYFLGIGLGYMFVQIGMHQRLVIVLGHPTLALSAVLFSMLLGTGIGAAWSTKLFPSARIPRAGSAILATLATLWLCLPLVPHLEKIHTLGLRFGVVALVLGAVGCVLGFAFPLGVRRVARTGEWAIQKMWAINGAASIAATVLAALVGLAWGTRAVLGCGLAAYAVAVMAGTVLERMRAPSST